MAPPNEELLWIMAGTFAALSVGTAIRLVALRKSTADVAKKRLGSLRVWWILTLLWSTAALLGQLGATVLLALASFLGLREYLRLVGTTQEIGRGTIAGLIALGAVHYGLIASGAGDTTKWLLPIGALLLLSACRLVACSTQDYIRITAGVYWGAMLLIYGLSHSLYLFDVESDIEPLVGNAGWFFFLVLLTEMNDIMQAIVGRAFGKHQITPVVSPNKSLEGLIGGLMTTILLSVTLAPCMTTIAVGRSLGVSTVLSAMAGVLISAVGFLGDINMSAIKRDAGVKDGSSLLPGMGGVIDRIDSLTLTAPAFYYFVVVLNHFARH